MRGGRWLDRHATCQRGSLGGGRKERTDSEADARRSGQSFRTACPNHTRLAAVLAVVPHNGVEKVLGLEASTHFACVSLDLVTPGLGQGAGDNQLVLATFSPPSHPPSFLYWERLSLSAGDRVTAYLEAGPRPVIDSLEQVAPCWPL